MLMSKRNKEWLESNGFEFEEKDAWYEWRREMSNKVVIDVALMKSNDNYGTVSVYDMQSGTMCNFPNHCAHMKRGHIEKTIEHALNYAKDRLVESLVRFSSVKNDLIDE